MILRHALWITCLLALTGCDSVELPSWAGGGDNKPKLQGERVTILKESQKFEVDSSLASVPFTLPEPQDNESWPQAMGSAQSYLGHPALASEIGQQSSGRIGNGNDWQQKIYTAPVVAGTTVFAMDARGFISAHQSTDLANVFWVTGAAVEEDEPDLLGGGLAYDDGKLFATTGYGKVIAIDPQSGKELWKQAINIPIRTAPKVLSDKVIVLTVDNQTIALSVATGDVLWTHRGISEAAGFIADIAPSVTDNIVITPYSSGEIVALDIATGQELWSDTLILNKRTTASDIFTGIGGVPVIADGIVYAVSNNGLLVATEINRGQRLWEQPISSDNTVWVAGDALFVLSRSQELFGLNRADGRIKWTTQLQAFEDEESKKHPIHWKGPVLAGGKLWVLNADGAMHAIDPQTGAIEKTLDIPSGIVEVPVVAGKTMFLLDKDASIHALK